ncbi:MAG: c-type cytochrome domain-containing protein [Pirellulales bacterium]
MIRTAFARIASRLAAGSAALLLACVAPAMAEEAPPAAAKITYDEHVQPIFREHCFSCHNADTKKSDLSVASFAGLTAGGASGAVIEPGDPDASRLWALVSHAEEPKMPPMQDKLPEAKLAMIKAWILGGALENSGSVAAAKKKPALEMSAASGAAKPEGPPPMPEKLSRQPAVYTPRASAVTALACSPWAPLAAVAGQKQITMYNTDSGALLGVLPFPEGVPYVLKFSRSGTLLLAGGGVGGKSGSVVVYDVKTGNRVFQVGDELDAVLAADINEDHTRIALGGPGRVVRIFSTADGSLVHEIRKHTEWIYALEFSPDGVLLATADRNGGLFVWEAETAREFQNLAGHKGGVNDVSWRADSNILASASEDGTIKLWEMEGGKEIKSWNAHAGGASSVEFAKDARLVSVGRDRLTRVWDPNGAAIRDLPAAGDIALEVAFTHDAGRVVSGDWLGEVRMSDVADGKQVAALAPNPPTLEMLVQTQTAAVNAAVAAAEQAAAELAAAEAVVAEKAKVAKAAADAAAAAKANLDSLASEKAAFDQSQSAQAAVAK